MTRRIKVRTHKREVNGKISIIYGHQRIIATPGHDVKVGGGGSTLNKAKIERNKIGKLVFPIKENKFKDYYHIYLHAPTKKDAKKFYKR